MTNTTDAACAAANAPGLPDDIRRLIERAEIVARQGGRRRRERLKDMIIAVLRERHDSAAWTAVLAEARARLERGEAC